MVTAPKNEEEKLPVGNGVDLNVSYPICNQSTQKGSNAVPKKPCCLSGAVKSAV